MSKTYREEYNIVKAKRRGIVDQKEKDNGRKKRKERPYHVRSSRDEIDAILGNELGRTWHKAQTKEDAERWIAKMKRSHYATYKNSRQWWITGPESHQDAEEDSSS